MSPFTVPATSSIGTFGSDPVLFLVEEGPISLSRVEEGHAALDRGANELDRILPVRRRTIAIA
jgi:hypothetical protein